MFGIYTVLQETDKRTKDNHKKFLLECNYCGKQVCMSLNSARKARSCKHALEIPIRHCLHCGKPIPMDWCSPNQYAERKYCSLSCAASENNKTTKLRPKKTCKNCGKELSNNQKVYCDQKCQWEFQYKEYIRKWKAGEVDGLVGDKWIDLSVYVRKYIFEKYHYRCVYCGWSRRNLYTGRLPLEIDHIDGDATNNKEENLVLLCPNCHSLTKTYRGANRGHSTRDIKWLSRSGIKYEQEEM